MGVVLADGVYQVARRPFPPPQDDNGVPVPGALGPAGPDRRGASTEQADGSWTLRLDPAEWPLRAGDVVTGGPDGARWTVVGNPRLFVNVAAGDVDYVGAAAALDEPPVSEPYTP